MVAQTQQHVGIAIVFLALFARAAFRGARGCGNALVDPTNGDGATTSSASTRSGEGDGAHDGACDGDASVARELWPTDHAEPELGVRFNALEHENASLGSCGRLAPKEATIASTIAGVGGGSGNQSVLSVDVP
jgi:hypothetical protein